MLSRQVTAALDRWNILPDDSAGMPLQLTPPGRFLRHVAALFQQDLTAEALLTLLKHPLTHTGAGAHDHLRRTRDLELHIRRKGLPYPDADDLTRLGASRPDERPRLGRLDRRHLRRPARASDAAAGRLAGHGTCARAEAHRRRVRRARMRPSSGPKTPAARLREIVADLLRRGRSMAATMDARDYGDLFGAILSRGEVRNPDTPHPAYPHLGHARGAGAGRRPGDPRRAERRQLARNARRRSLAEPQAAP